MRKRNKIIITLLLLIISVVCSCVYLFRKYGTSEKSYKVLLNEINNSIENNEINVNGENVDISKYKYEYEPEELGIDEKDLVYIKSPDDSTQFENKIIGKEEAISDVEFMFKVLKHAYGCYNYFGGDEAFDNAKNNIVEEIKNDKGTVLSSERLSEIIIKNLNFIQDGHFTINNKHINDRIYYFSNEDMEFYKSEKGYYKVQDGKKYYLMKVDDSFNVEDYLKLSVNKEGDLCYYLGYLKDINKQSFSTSVTFKDNNNEIIETVVLKKGTFQVKPDETNYEYTMENEIPIIKVRRMYAKDENDDSLENFIQSGKMVKGKEVIVIDLRGNGGGSDYFGMSWFKNFIGEYPMRKRNLTVLRSLINSYVENQNVIEMGNEESDETNEASEEDKINDWYYEISKEIHCDNNINDWYDFSVKEIKHENSTKIFVLIDKNIASAGEDFISYLKTLDNVILIGSNTDGTYLSNIHCKLMLPNSTVKVLMGNFLEIHEDCPEGEGFKPDIWINSEDSKERVLKMIKKYN